MEDLRSILSTHNGKNGEKESKVKSAVSEPMASVSEIPDLFFDEILVRFKLNRIDTLVLMYLYRVTWCRANLHRKFGITPMVSHTDIAERIEITIDVLQQTINRLESFKFIETIRSGQYFVRKYFTEENDKKFNQNYDNFL